MDVGMSWLIYKLYTRSYLGLRIKTRIAETFFSVGVAALSAMHVMTKESARNSLPVRSFLKSSFPNRNIEDILPLL